MENIRKDINFHRRSITCGNEDTQAGESFTIRQKYNEWKRSMSDSFKRMPRRTQEKLIEKNAVAMSVGMTVTVLNSIYRFLPLLLRVWTIPALVVGSYVFGKKVLTPFLLEELRHHLNPKIEDDEFLASSDHEIEEGSNQEKTEVE